MEETQKTAQDVMARGYRTVNYIRLGLAFLFAAAVAASWAGDSTGIMIRAEAVGTVVYFLVGILGLVVMRGGRIPKRYSRTAIFIDMAVLGSIIIVGCSDSRLSAFDVVKDSTVYAVFYIILGYSALLGSALLTFSLSLWAAAIYTASLFVAANTGIQFGDTEIYSEYTVGLVDFAIMVVYMPVVGGIISGSIRMQNVLSSISDGHARSNAELVSSLTDQKHVLAMHAKDLDQATEQFKEYIEDTTRRIESQAAALEQANAVTEELTASASQTSSIVEHQSKGIETMAEGSTELNALVNEIGASNQQLTESASDAVRSMATVLSAVQGTNEILGRLEEAFANVSQITEVMTEIADKTNLLSLNASIEAARAGDAGRGFAVVANEVSKLADFTGQNVRQIAQIVSDSMNTIDEARKQADEASQQATHQKEQTNRTNEQAEKTSNLLKKQASILEGLIRELSVQRNRASDVMNSSREQIDGQKELARTMESLDKEISQINETARNLSDGINRISTQATELARLSETEFAE